MLYKFRFHFFAVPFRGLFRTFLNINQELFFSKLVCFFSVSNAIFKDEFPIKFYETVFMKTVINFQYFTPAIKNIKKIFTPQTPIRSAMFLHANDKLSQIINFDYAQ